MPTSIYFASLNVRSVRDLNRFREAYNLFRSLSLDVFLLQEVRLTPADALRLNATYTSMQLIVHPHNLADSGGVAIMYNPHKIRPAAPCPPTADGQYSDENYLYDAEGRLLLSRFYCGNFPFNAVSVYAPAQSTPRSAWHLLTTDFLLSLPPDRLCGDVVGGDWNMIDRQLDRSPPRLLNFQEVARFHSLLLSFRDPDDPLLDGFRESSPDRIEFSHQSLTGSARLDRIYVSSSLFPQCSDWDIEAGQTSLNLDHHLARCSLNLRSNLSRGPGRFRFNVNLRRAPKVLRANSQFMISCGRAAVSPPVWAALKAQWGRALATLSLNRKHALRHRRSALKARKKRLVHRRTLPPDPVLERRIEALMVRERTLNEYATKAYSYSAMAKNRLLGERPTHWFFARGQPSLTSCTIECLNPPGGGVSTSDPDEMLRIATLFYSSLFSDQSSTPELSSAFTATLPMIPRSSQRILRAPITSDEVVSAIRRAATGKSPGPDGLPVELFKTLLATPHTRVTCVESLLTLFDGLLNGDLPTPDFSAGILSLLYKNRGSPLDLKNYRPLTVTNADYKLFTSILADRFAAAVGPAIGPHQFAFLPGRLIDDNIRLVQSLIDLYKADVDSGIYLLFLDQEKAYDRVSHPFLWGSLKALGVPRKVRRCIKALYSQISLKIMINGFLSDAIEVHSGVRQGDPLSCILYNIFLEPFIRTLLRDPVLQGAGPPGQPPTKALCYADDTVLILNNQIEADRLQFHLDTFCATSGAKINWDKSTLLRVGNPPPVTITGVQVASDLTPIVHLGIPVGPSAHERTTTVWQCIRHQCAAISRRWASAHLSLKGRVLIANSLMMSLPRFHLKFLPIPPECIKQLVAIYYAFIWEQKTFTKISDCHTLLAKDHGGIGCLDLHSVLEALSLQTLGSMIGRPDLQWVQVTIYLASHLPTRAASTVSSVVNRPWVQTLSSRNTNERDLPSCLLPFWPTWLRILNDPGKGVSLREPATASDVLAINFWYHPKLKVTPGRGARRFHTKGFQYLAERGVQTLGELWLEGQPSLPLFTPPTLHRQLLSSVQQLFDDLPPRWRSLLASSPASTPSSFQEDVVMCLGDTRFAPLSTLSFRSIYSQLIALKTSHISNHARVLPLLAIYTNFTGLPGSPEMVWRAARDTFLTPKAGDLLWRFLHEKVLVGGDLHWLDASQQCCPRCNTRSSIEHLWIRCPTASALWEIFRLVWNTAWGLQFPGQPYPALPELHSRADLLTWFALPPFKPPILARRWRVLYSTAVWTLWLSYLKFSFGESENSLFERSVLELFLKLVANRIQEERLLSLNSLYSNRTYNTNLFEDVWCQPPGTAASAKSDFLILLGAHAHIQ